MMLLILENMLLCRAVPSIMMLFLEALKRLLAVKLSVQTLLESWVPLVLLLLQENIISHIRNQRQACCP